MTKYIVDFWMDGYESDEEREKAQEEFIYDQLNMTASSVTISKFEKAQALIELFDEIKILIQPSQRIAWGEIILEYIMRKISLLRAEEEEEE